MEALAAQLDPSLKDTKAEMPTENPDFNPSRGGKRFNLESTRSLAEKERRLFESRLKAASDGSPR